MSVSEAGWHPMASGRPPAWAATWGADVYGVFAGILVGGTEYRFRWIPAGEFVMGSPLEELGRDDDEMQHVVAVSGFWLGETPVTQAMMENHESRFRSQDRPVENISCDQCLNEITRLNAEIVGLDARLPSEAEWEYACRAGTKTATYAGDLDLRGVRNAPNLDEVAWYGGNSGVALELENGYDSSDWPEKQYPHTRAGTHPVRAKRPNSWGLYDMLGNVFEWCSDWFDAYPTERLQDPMGPDSGVFRVVRGGSWSSHARRVRAAFRGGREPGYRDGNLGFRLARGQESSGAGEGEAPV